MGMFDNVICKYQLPGNPPVWIGPEHHFQTKDMECQLNTYRIEADGRFSEPSFTGSMEFYTGNIVGSGPAIYTQDGEDAETVEYTAKIVDGMLTELTETGRSRKPAFPRAKQIAFIVSHPPTPEEIAAWKTRQSEPLVGHRLYVLWGGEDKGYWVKAVYQSGRQLCAQIETPAAFKRVGELELLDTTDRDRILWDSEEAALTSRSAEKAKWQAARREYEEYVASRQDPRP